MSIVGLCGRAVVHNGIHESHCQSRFTHVRTTVKKKKKEKNRRRRKEEKVSIKIPKAGPLNQFQFKWNRTERTGISFRRKLYLLSHLIV